MKELELFNGKRCVSCGRYFEPDARIGERQKCCPAVECRKKYKRLRDREWRRRNPGYFQDRYEVVKAWRQEHPGYQSQWRAKKRLRDKMAHEIQVEIPPERPIKSMRLHLRCKLRLGEIQAQTLKVTQVGQAFWVDGAGTQAA